MPPKKEKGKETFEAMMQKMENIVEKLDNDTLPLDEAIALYEEGMACATFCSNKLNEVKQRIDVLVQKENGTREREPFDADAGDEA